MSYSDFRQRSRCSSSALSGASRQATLRPQPLQHLQGQELTEGLGCRATRSSLRCLAPDPACLGQTARRRRLPREALLPLSSQLEIPLRKMTVKQFGRGSSSPKCIRSASAAKSSACTSAQERQRLQAPCRHSTRSTRHIHTCSDCCIALSAWSCGWLVMPSSLRRKLFQNGCSGSMLPAPNTRSVLVV